ncbi:HNH endonuclease [Paraburkholderia sp. SEWSISQ10-3 4]|uniref:HNH endonuclease n=1 Tax=Paraburkholderia TaxID=1822464 RepID=UPI0022581C17|nr:MULTISPECIES: HNH endonuclease [Paraburkholderia]MCX4139339.1 HNH endonuclease [Paraburkholderia aspalathi]MDN7172027.1 HNH endonuclease [Paraburkholderia sp. SEWSISQ10-3 4]MDQ6501666.1 HNH endonuclease [Paraburkholderia aspalathi]
MFAIAPTDLDWFERLRAAPTGRSVNFWTPTPWGVKGLGAGNRLYFMLKAPVRKIGGYGIFRRYIDMTASEAWRTYGLGNGVDSQTDLVSKVEGFARKRAGRYVSSVNPVIGCIELEDIVMLDDDQFISPEPFGHSFPREVVKLKYFSEPDGLASYLGTSRVNRPFELVIGFVNRKPSQRKDRKRQPVFRQQVLRNYGYRCCVYGESVVELLEAAHIQPYINEQSNHPQNGLCLRVDLHRLFDEGLLAVTDEFTLMVSSQLADSSYAGLQGKKLALPENTSAHPSSEALALHRDSFR